MVLDSSGRSDGERGSKCVTAAHGSRRRWLGHVLWWLLPVKPTIRWADHLGFPAGAQWDARLRSGQSTLDACPQAFRRTNPPPRLRTQESVAALSFGMLPSTRRTNRGP